MSGQSEAVATASAPEQERFIHYGEAQALPGYRDLSQQASKLIMNMAPGNAFQPGPNDIVISPSQLTTWLTCRLQWYFYKVAEVPRTEKLAPAWGTAMHQLLEQYNRGATREELFEYPDGGDVPQALRITSAVLDKVPGIDVPSVAQDVVDKTSNYLDATGWVRYNNPEEDATVYLFTLVDHAVIDDIYQHEPINTRVFLRGITDFSTERVIGHYPPEIADGTLLERAIYEIVLGDYKSAGRKWPAGKTDREMAPTFYALRERVRRGLAEVSLVHEVILKNPQKCKEPHRDAIWDAAEGSRPGHDNPTEICYQGMIIGQRFITTRGLQHMTGALVQIAQFAVGRARDDDDIDLHPPSPGWDGQNCRMCDYQDACGIQGGVRLIQFGAGEAA